MPMNAKASVNAAQLTTAEALRRVGRFYLTAQSRPSDVSAISDLVLRLQDLPELGAQELVASVAKLLIAAALLRGERNHVTLIAQIHAVVDVTAAEVSANRGKILA